MVSFKINFRSALGLAAVAAAIVLTAGTPAQALSPGCTCPAGSRPVIGANLCFTPQLGAFAPTCTAPAPGPAPTPAPAPVAGGAALNQSIGHVAASQQQLSFWGIREILEGRRDQLQGTLGKSPTRPMISGYAE